MFTQIYCSIPGAKFGKIYTVFFNHLIEYKCLPLTILYNTFTIHYGKESSSGEASMKHKFFVFIFIPFNFNVPAA